MADQWRNRIIGEGEIAAGELVPHPQNWRKHPKMQANQLAGTLGGVGWVQRVIVNQRTGRMLDGHLRAELARGQGEQTPVPVLYVDLSEDEERTILATLDPIAGMAIPDEATLAALVQSIGDADLHSIADRISGPPDNPYTEWHGMPEFQQEDKTAWKSLTVNFSSMDDLQGFSKLIGQSLTEKTRSIWYPQAEIERYADKRYTDES